MWPGRACSVTPGRCHLGQRIPTLLWMGSCPGSQEREPVHGSPAETWKHTLATGACLTVPAAHVWASRGRRMGSLVPWLCVPMYKVEQAAREVKWLKTTAGNCQEEELQIWSHGGLRRISKDNTDHPAAAKPGSNMPVMLPTDVCLSSPGNSSLWRAHSVLLRYKWGFVAYPNVMLQVSFSQFRHITYYSLKIQWISSSVCSLEYIWSLTWCLPLVFFR